MICPLSFLRWMEKTARSLLIETRRTYGGRMHATDYSPDKTRLAATKSAIRATRSGLMISLKITQF
jgi:hypothetical protein